MTEKQKVSEQIVKISARLHQKNMLAAADGNISYRLDSGEIMITPSGVSKGFMSPEQMALMTPQGQPLEGKPSSEKSMHLRVYERCPKAKAVVHAHPPHAIAWSVAFPELKELPSKSLSEIILACGSIPFVPYARPGTAQMGEHLEVFLPQHRVMILRSHGALTWGEDLEEAYLAMERLEHSAQILYLAKSIGDLHELPGEEVAVLREMRKKMGERTL